MAEIFESSQRPKSKTGYRYVPINVDEQLESSGGYVSSEAGSYQDGGQGLPDLGLEDDCLPPPTNGYGSFRRGQRKTVISRMPDGDVPPYRAVFLVTNAAFGAGILNFPQAYMNAGGIETAVIVQCIMLVFIIGAFLIIARCANKSQSPTYQDLVLFMCGPKAKMASQILIIIYFFGGCITYLIIIGEQASKVLMYILKVQDMPWYADKRFLMCLISIIFILPLCIPKRLKVLSYSSFFGGIGAIFITCIVVYKYFSGNYKASIIHNKSVPQTKTSITSVMTAIPVICFGYQCHVSSVAVYADLKNRSMVRFFVVTCVAMFICTTSYGLCGSFGYLTFGMDTQSDVLINYNADDVLANVARAMVILIIFSSFAIITFCARTAVEDIVLKWRGLGPDEAERHERRRRLVETFTWFGSALLLAAVIPNIGVAIALIGGIAALFIFVFPGMCLLQSVNLRVLRKLYVREKILIFIGCVYIVIGVFIFGENTTLAISEDIKSKSLY